MARLDVLPVLSGANVANGRRIDIQFFRQYCAGQLTFSNHENISLGQFSVPVSCTSCMTVSLNHLSHIPGLGAKTEVLRLHADRAVARMQDVQPMSIPAIDAVRDDVRPVLSPIKCHDTVSVTLESSSGPVPTSFIWWIAWHMPGEGFSLGHPSGLPGRAACERVSIAEESASVRRTESPATRRSIAPLDRADHDSTLVCEVHHREN